ncbi:flagellar biosynthetic protein FliO [Thalassotalea agariperforans]
MKKVGSLLLLLMVMMPAWAETATGTPEVGKHVAGNMDAASMILSLLMVLALIVIGAYILKKFNLTNTQSDGIKIVTSLHLSTKEKLVVVQVGDKQLLLGVTANQINVLDTLAEPLEVKAPVNQQFAESIQKLLKKQS